MRLIIDTSSILKTCLYAGKDPQAIKVRDAEDPSIVTMVNTAEYGYENAVNSLVATIKRYKTKPRKCVFVMDGFDSNQFRRRLLVAGSGITYKEKEGPRVKERDEQFQLLRDMIQTAFQDVGAIFAQREGMEADDLIALLALESDEPCVVVSRDNDLAVLNGINRRGKEVLVDLDGVVGQNKFGPFPFEMITLYKALVGDTSDRYPGIRGFGPAKFLKLYEELGDEGMRVLAKTLDERRGKDIDYEGSPLLAVIAQNYLAAEVCYSLAKIYPDKIYTNKAEPVFTTSCVKAYDETKDERLQQWMAVQVLVTAENFDEMRPSILAAIKSSPFVALDIETATPPESDDWLEAKARRASDTDKVDVFGSELVSMALTFGSNSHFTAYFTVGHKQEPGYTNITSEQLRDLLVERPRHIPLVIHNLAFELAVLLNEWGVAWRDNGYSGMLPNVLDTKLEASYVNENEGLGLKGLSKRLLGYDQTSYQEVTQGRKMDQMTARETFSYGTDDTVCTAALHNLFEFIMRLENTWQVYLDVEISPAYLTAQAFCKGVPISLEKVAELEAIDQKLADQCWSVINPYLISKGWDGTVCPTYGPDITAAQIKEAYTIVTGNKLETQMRTISKIATFLIHEAGAPILGQLIETENWAELNKYVARHFDGTPQFNLDSPKQMQRLMYEVMGLKERVFNRPTDVQKEKKRLDPTITLKGSVKTDELAMAYALKYDCVANPEIKPIIEALRTLKMVSTRQKMYYTPYKFFKHWKDNMVHAGINQCATNTRRYTSSDPNLQQMPKHPKATGEPARFREVIVAHKRNAVIVSMDFSSQELRVIAEYSQDPNMLACYVGDQLKDMHLLTGLGIWNRTMDKPTDYERLAQFLEDTSCPEYKHAKSCRTLGKKVNFTTEYGAQAPKLAQTMLITEEEAQAYIDAKLDAFPVAAAWKNVVVAEVKRYGYVTTMLGARRHLVKALNSTDSYEASKAERQAVNFKVQGSSAEMTKLAMKRMWDTKLFDRYDSLFIAPIHDEIVASVVVDQLIPFLREMHACMVAPYADMQIPIVSSISIGPNFGEQIEVGESVDEEVIAKAVEQIFPKKVDRAVA